jgi:uncharacterized delta-60 repeat protein
MTCLRIGFLIIAPVVFLFFSCTPASDLFLDIKDLVFPPPIPGDLDPTFGEGDGIVTTPIGSAQDSGNALEIQTDGKILVSGSSFNGLKDDFALVRYTTTGLLDTTFGGGDGIVTTSLDSFSDTGYALGIQTDGKILVAGRSHNGTDFDLALVRYTPAGNPDTTFGGGDGIVTTPIGSGSDIGYALGIQTDGKILVTGSSYNSGSGDDFALVRYTDVGDLDTTFGGGDGIVTTSIGDSTDAGYAIAIQTDGKVLVAGYTYETNDYDFALARYTSAGVLDTAFGGGDGIVTLPIGSSNDYCHALEIQKDDKILVAGSSIIGGTHDFALVRYTTGGDLDTTFGGGDGIVTTPIGSDWDTGHALGIQTDDKILVCGSANNGTDTDVALVRYTSTGDLDTTFGGGDGIVTTQIGSDQEVGYALGIQADGKILVAGYYEGTNWDFALLRYLP